MSHETDSPDRPAPARDLTALRLMDLPVEGPAVSPDLPVTGLAVDSRQVRDGFVFVAIPGTKLDGAEFATYAIRQGAVAVVATPEGVEKIRAGEGGLPIPVFLTETPRAKLAQMAAAFYGTQPAVIGAVTGTNGKTSTASFLAQIWQGAGEQAAVFGTTGVEGPDFTEPLAHTTPEPITLHGLLARLVERGVTHAAMEASSHGLAQHRLDGVRLSVAGFSNISRDHLDYHASFEDYRDAKLRLFADVLPPDGVAVINVRDGAMSDFWQAAERRGQRIVSVGPGVECDLRVVEQRFRPDGQDVRLVWDGAERLVPLPLVGAFQAENVALAAAMALGSGTEAKAVFHALPGLHGVKGRMELVAKRQNGAAIYVDYAHTPDALRVALQALRPHCRGRLVVVFGAGGDRDPGKRPMMGKAASDHADLAIVTDDNPRSEDPAKIRAAIMAACPEADEIGGRAAAILAGIDALKVSEDMLLIAGKGHEQGQEIAGEVLPFDDGDQARASVAALDGMQAEIMGRQ